MCVRPWKTRSFCASVGCYLIVNAFCCEIQVKLLWVTYNFAIKRKRPLSAINGSVWQVANESPDLLIYCFLTKIDKLSS
jgi:hypothetical protein